MLGKLILPLLLGGGVVFALASSSSAQAQPAPKNAFDFLPEHLRQLAGQALATNDPNVIEQVAARLEAEGYREQPRLLRVAAAQLRQRAAGQATNPFEFLPPALRTLAAQAQASNDPATLHNLASQLEAQGFLDQSRVLRQQAAAIENQRSQASSAVVQSPSLASAAVPAASVQAATRMLSPELQNMMAEAIRNGTPAALTSTAFVIEKAGFPEIAAELRQRAKDAAANIPAPAPQDRPNVALDPSMPMDLALEVARQLQLQGDPTALEALAREMRKRGFNNTADQLDAKAKQVRAALDAARTMNEIDREFKSPGVVQSPGIVQAPALPPPPPTPPAPAPATTQIPIMVTATPPAPVVVPVTPQPQPTPPEKAKAHILANTLANSLNELLDRFGGVPKARYKEDKAMVQRFQVEEGLKTDGQYGPKTAEHVARYVNDVPPPFYWPKGSGQKDLSRYRTNIQTLALEAEQVGNIDRAERLRASALKASLA